jgi:uncharacterized protein with HEPN domain
MRREELYLADIVEAADAIARYLAGVDRDAFIKNEEKRDAVLLKLILIGEAAARLRVAFRKKHPDVQWARVITFRNLAVHVYFAVKWESVWAAATQDAPKVRGLVADILAKEFPDRLPFAKGE